MTVKRHIAIFCCLALLLAPTCLAGESSYGPGHEAHQYACWDNGDDKHTVACDCGVEKRVEPHGDADADGICDGCGLGLALDELFALPEGWVSCAYGPGGIEYALPGDMTASELTDEQLKNGFVAICANDDITIRLRAYAPGAMTYAEFVNIIKNDTMADYTISVSGDTELICYSNPSPAGQSELCGVALTGTDGRLYKFAVFAGDDAAHDAARELTDILASSVRIAEMEK